MSASHNSAEQIQENEQFIKDFVAQQGGIEKVRGRYLSLSCTCF